MYPVHCWVEHYRQTDRRNTTVITASQFTADKALLFVYTLSYLIITQGISKCVYISLAVLKCSHLNVIHNLILCHICLCLDSVSMSLHNITICHGTKICERLISSSYTACQYTVFPSLGDSVIITHDLQIYNQQISFYKTFSSQHNVVEDISPLPYDDVPFQIPGISIVNFFNIHIC